MSIDLTDIIQWHYLILNTITLMVYKFNLDTYDTYAIKVQYIYARHFFYKSSI